MHPTLDKPIFGTVADVRARCNYSARGWRIASSWAMGLDGPWARCTGYCSADHLDRRPSMGMRRASSHGTMACGATAPVAAASPALQLAVLATSPRCRV